MTKTFTEDFWKEFYASSRKKMSIKISLWIGGAIATSVVDTLLKGENLFEVYRNWLWGVIVLAALPILMVSITAVLAVRKVVIGLYHNTNNVARGTKEKRNIELPEFIHEPLAFIPQVDAKWEPPMNAQTEEFIGGLKYLEDSDVLCSKCKGQLVVTHRESGVIGVMEYYSCGCRQIHNLFEVDLRDMKEALVAHFKQYVRTNFEDVLNMYIVAFDKYVRGPR